MQFIGFVEAETPRAFLFWDHYWEEPDWMPKSQCEVSRSEDTHEVKIIASAWICKQKQIEEFEQRGSSGDRTGKST